MLYAMISLIALFVIFVVVMFFVTKKSYTLSVNNKVVKITNAGSKLKVYIDGALYQTYQMPQLVYGEKYEIEVDNTPYTLKVKSNNMGSKLSVKIFDANENIVATNNVEIK